MNTVVFEICAFILSFFCIIYSVIVKRAQYSPPRDIIGKLSSQHFVFLNLLTNVMLSSLASVVGYFLELNRSADTVFFQHLFHIMYYVFHTALPVSFALYIMNINGATLGRKKSFFVYLLSLFMLSELLVLSNPFTHLVFYIDESYVYHRGPMILFQYLCGLAYVLVGIYFIIKNKAAIPKNDFLTICIAIIVALVGIALQAAFANLYVELFFEAIAFLAMMLLLEDRTGEVDPITGSGSRSAFIRNVTKLLETDQSFSVIGIKLINLEFYSSLFSGQDIDLILKNVYGWLASVYPSDYIFHFRNEDFAIIVYNRSEREVEEFANELLAKFNYTWQSEDLTARLEAGVSVIRVPEDSDSVSEISQILSAPDSWFHNGQRICLSDDINLIKRDILIEKAIRLAVNERRLKVWYQPIWSAETGKIVAAEALVRLFDPVMGHISSEEFIPLAEKIGLISDIGTFVYEETCSFISRNNIETIGLDYIEVNISVYQFVEDGIVDKLERIRKTYGVRPDQLNLEITESVSSDEAPNLNSRMQEMNSLGYSFSLDDYGSGYSNLIRLINSKYKNVKIDKYILWNSEKNKDTSRLLDSLIKIIRSLGLNVIQEGVENEAQLSRVLNSGCNLIQGYYFCKPVPEDEFLNFVKTFNSKKDRKK
ncbi:MAG: EAL domain-containing protein [Oscillospiraceae bacterium]|nr:EAL domain-containing protein [Oscillospiraceae bacterium]